MQYDATTTKILRTMKADAQIKAICKKCGEDGSDHSESTCKLQWRSPGLKTVKHGKEKELMKIKYIQDIPFLEV